MIWALWESSAQILGAFFFGGGGILYSVVSQQTQHMCVCQQLLDPVVGTQFYIDNDKI